MPSREWKRANRREPWYPGETLITGIGQGYMLTTPLQLAQSMALLANRGQWHRPRLLKSADGMNPEELIIHDLLEARPAPDDIVLRDMRYWDVINHDMQQVVHGPRGTARKIGTDALYRIAGKSGTAQVVAIRQGEKYDREKTAERHRDHALFVGFAPAENPRIAVAVLVENGESGSGVAAPVLRQVTDAWLLDADGNLKEAYRALGSAPGAGSTP